MNTCHICNVEYSCSDILRLTSHDTFCNSCFFTWIEHLNLGIDIDIADFDEWSITAKEDTFDDNQTIRLRNPKTNLPLTDSQIKYIYDYYHTHNS